MSNNIRIIITGATGFIGGALLKHYLSTKKYDLRNIDIRRPENIDVLSHWRDVDIRHRNALQNEFDAFAPDYVIHLAARTDLNGKNLSDYSSNTVGTDTLIKVCNQTPSVKRVLFASSMLVCKPGYLPEHDLDFCPSTVYGESKVQMEEAIRATKHSYTWAIVRPTSIWGPGFAAPYRHFFEMVKRHRYVHPGNRACTKTYGYIANTVHQIDAILNAPDSQIANQVFYLGDYQPTNIRQWADEIAQELGYKVSTAPFSLISLAARVGDALSGLSIDFPMTSFRLKNMTTDNVLDLSNTKAIAPKLPVSRKDGIRQTLAWLLDHPS